MTLINMPAAPTKVKKRAYRSELRQKQAAATRAVILDAVGRLLGEPDRDDFTMADVAREAEVASATVFRHFEHRQALFDAYIDRAAERFRIAPAIVERIDDMPERVHQVFAFYDDQGDIIRAALRTPWLLALNEPSRIRRAKRLQELVAERFPGLDEQTCREAAARLQWAASTYSWWWYVDKFNLDTPRAAELAASAIRSVLDELAQKETAAS